MLLSSGMENSVNEQGYLHHHNPYNILTFSFSRQAETLVPRSAFSVCVI